MVEKTAAGAAENRTISFFFLPVNMLSVSATNTIYVPAGARLLHVREQKDYVALWYEIPDPSAPTEPHRFQLFGTGTGPIHDGLEYVGTCIFADGMLVIHVYELINSSQRGQS